MSWLPQPVDCLFIGGIRVELTSALFARKMAVLAVLLCVSALSGCFGNNGCGAEYFENMVYLEDGDFTVALSQDSTATTAAITKASSAHLRVDRDASRVILTYTVDGKKYVDTYK